MKFVLERGFVASLALLGEFHAALITREFAGLNFRERLHHVTAYGALHLGFFWLHGLHFVDSRQALLTSDALHPHSESIYTIKCR